MSGAASLLVKVRDVTQVTPRIKRFRLTSVDGEALPAWAPGAHILLTLGDGESTWRNAYSLMGSPTDRSSYQISVLHTESSRGGSHHIHKAIQPGTRVSISRPVNLFPLAALARKHVFVAGGVGITPFLPMMEQLNSHAAPFEMHYAVKSAEQGAYVTGLARAYGDQLHVYESEKHNRLDPHRVLNNQPLGTHLYVCGPASMMDAILIAARQAGWPANHLHSERFLAGSAGKPFNVSLAKSNQSLSVGEHQSLLEAIEAIGVDPPFLCRGGSCGQCETSVLACDTDLIHNDHCLSPEEQQANQKIMICVSRAQGGTLVLDL